MDSLERHMKCSEELIFDEWWPLNLESDDTQKTEYGYKRGFCKID